MATSNSFGKSSSLGPNEPESGVASVSDQEADIVQPDSAQEEASLAAPTPRAVKTDGKEAGLSARPQDDAATGSLHPALLARRLAPTGGADKHLSAPIEPHVDPNIDPQLDLTRSSAKQAGQAYKTAGVRPGSSSGELPGEPWDALDSGSVAWADFSPAEQEKIARHYAPKVKYLATRLKARLPRNVDLGELISAGSMGLVESFSKFKPDLGVKFSTYAENRIRGAMLDELRRLDWFPRSLRQKVRQIDSAIIQSEQNTGRIPNEAELSAMTGLSEKDVREGLEALQNQACFSLDALENVLSGDDGPRSGEPYAETATREMIERMADLIEQLTPREKLVLSLYYSDELNMRETAEVMGITEGRVSQLHSQALSRLRKEFNSQHGLYSS